MRLEQKDLRDSNGKARFPTEEEEYAQRQEDLINYYMNSQKFWKNNSNLVNKWLVLVLREVGPVSISKKALQAFNNDRPSVSAHENLATNELTLFIDDASSTD